MHLVLTLIAAFFIAINLSKAAVAKNNNDVEEYLQGKHGLVCVTPGCVRAASTVFKNIDQSVEPCDDFYKFACGTYLKETTIADDRSYASYVYVIADKIVDQLRLALESPPSPNELKAFKILKQFYKLCLNTSAIEDDGLQTIKVILADLGGGWPVLEGLNWRDEKFDWKNTKCWFRDAGLQIDSILKVYVAKDVKNSSRNIIDIDQGSLGLNRQHLIKGFGNKIVKSYYDYLVDVAVIFGADADLALKDMKDTVEFEIELAKISLSEEERRNATLLTNVMTVAELQQKFPSISWLEYLNHLIHLPGVTLGPSDTVDLGVPTFVAKLEKLLSRTSKRVLANYLMIQAVIDQATHLTKELRERKLKYSENLDGITQSEPRWMECIRLTAPKLDIAAGALYVRNYLNEDAKRNAADLVHNLRKTFVGILKEVDWMDSTTRQKAIDKANAMYAHIAYPQELLDDNKLDGYYEDLDPSIDNFFKFLLSVEKFNADVNFKKLPEPVNKTDWKEHSDLVTVNAFNILSENSIWLPAGILQGVFFDNERPHYMNYGSMGFVVGHEITHGFDDQGRQFDAKGELAEWWEEKTRETFLKKTQCIIDQYGNYSLPDLKINLNGINTQGENIADNGGLKEAYLAYKAWVERNGEEPRLPGLKYTPKQMFWISAANFWCEKDRDEYLKQEVLTNVHSPSYFRVLGAFSNSEYFADDFNCPVGSKMNPEHKCQVW